MDVTFEVTNSAINKLADNKTISKESRIPATPIVAFLKNRLSHDAELASNVMQDHKTLQKCFDYVNEQVCKRLSGKIGYLEDDVVYQMAVDYFKNDDAALEQQKAEAEAQRIADVNKRADERKAQSAATQTDKDAHRKSVEANKKVVAGQQSLFDLGDDDNVSKKSIEAA